jgi:hypothetical protein
VEIDNDRKWQVFLDQIWAFVSLRSRSICILCILAIGSMLWDLAKERAIFWLKIWLTSFWLRIGERSFRLWHCMQFIPGQLFWNRCIKAIHSTFSLQIAIDLFAFSIINQVLYSLLCSIIFLQYWHPFEITLDIG